MPIDYKEYHPKWTLIRRLILKRAKHRCEWCHIDNHAIVLKADRETQPSRHHYENFNTMKRQGYSMQQIYKIFGFTPVVLTIAHLNHSHTDHEDYRFSNLAALCQKCHLGHDAKQHQANRKYGRYHNRKHQLKLL